MQRFREFLEEQEEQLRAERDKKQETIDRWTQCVSELTDQVTQWLEEDDSRKLLKIEPGLIEINEESLGSYHAASLTILLGGRSVKFVPVSCLVRGPTIMWNGRRTDWLGRVDMIGSNIYNLYYGQGVYGPTWVAVNDSNFQVDEFTREFFEDAMVELFS